ncbi:MAG: hypothetical protein ABSF95_00505 [Verrucomicrobiota bacterium]|jgi:hypothetical protein
MDCCLLLARFTGLLTYTDRKAYDRILVADAIANRAHPDVLQVRWRAYADAQNWDACLDT